MEARARRLGSCETAQVIALRGYRRRLLGSLDAAEELLKQALDLAPRCRFAADSVPNPCELDLNRRLAILEAAQGRPADGFRRAQRVLDGYEVLGNPGHDLNGDGIASSLYARGEIRYELGDFDGCAADFSTCLDRYPISSKVWLRVQQDLATALLETGPVGRDRAFRIQNRVRFRMRSRSGTAEYAFFWWTDGQLTIALGKQRGIDKLEKALGAFLKQGMRHHYAGVAHDIVRAMFPDQERIRRFLRRIEPVASTLCDERQMRLLQKILDLAKTCPRPDTPLDILLSRLDNALRQLREIAGSQVSLPPCLIL